MNSEYECQYPDCDTTTPSNNNWAKNLFLLLAASATTAALTKLYRDGYFDQTQLRVMHFFRQLSVTKTEAGTQTEAPTKNEQATQTDTVATSEAATGNKSVASSDADSCGGTPDSKSPHQPALPTTENAAPALSTNQATLFGKTENNTTAQSAAGLRNWFSWRPF